MDSDTSTAQVETGIAGLYAGALFALLAAHYEPKLAEETIRSLGPVLSPIILLLVGIATYIFYRVILGEWILYPLRHFLHSLIDRGYRWWKKPDDAYISFTALLGKQGVPWGYRRLAYSELRDSFFEETRRQQLDLLHATYHIFYITAVELWGAAGYLYPDTRWKLLVLLGVVALLCGYVADIRQDMWECKLLQQKPDKLASLLKEKGFIKRSKLETPPG